MSGRHTLLSKPYRTPIGSEYKIWRHQSTQHRFEKDRKKDKIGNNRLRFSIDILLRETKTKRRKKGWN